MIDIYLCDDDASARSRIQTILEKKILIEDYDMQLVCSSDSAEALLHALGDRRQNLYLLDVELRDAQWDGFLLGRELRRRDPHGTLIYITGYGDLAFRTFQYHLEAFDYIVKTPDRLEASIHRCLEEFQNRLLLERPAPAQVYTIQTGTSLRHIPLSEILFFETAPRPHHVLLHTPDSRMDFLGSLNEIETRLGKGSSAPTGPIWWRLTRSSRSIFGTARFRWADGNACSPGRRRGSFADAWMLHGKRLLIVAVRGRNRDASAA